MVPGTASNAATKLILRSRQAGKPQTTISHPHPEGQSTGSNQVAAAEVSLLKTAAVVTLIVASIVLTVSGLAKYNDQLQKTGHTSLFSGMTRAASR